MHIEETDLAAHLPIFIHMCELRANEKSARHEAAKQYRKKMEPKDAEKKERARDTPSKCDDSRDAGRDAGRAVRPGPRFVGPSWPLPLSSPETKTIRLPPFLW